MKLQYGMATFLSCALLTAQCGNPMEKAALQIPADAPEVVIDPKADIKARQRNVNVRFAEQVGDYLVLSITYQGGCEDHEFRLVSKGKYTATYPPELEVMLVHDDKGDLCRSTIDERRFFNISKLQYNGTNRVLLVLTNTDRTIMYSY
jgi:hypothetical protein